MKLLGRTAMPPVEKQGKSLLLDQENRAARILRKCYRLLDISKFSQEKTHRSRIRAVCKTALKGFTTTLTSSYDKLTRTVCHRCLIMRNDLPFRVKSQQNAINLLNKAMRKRQPNQPVISVNPESGTISVSSLCSFTTRIMERQSLLIKQIASRLKELLKYVEYQLPELLSGVNEDVTSNRKEVQNREKKLLEVKMHIVFSCLDLGISEKTDEHRAVSQDKIKQKQDLIHQIRDESNDEFDGKQLRLFWMRQDPQQGGQTDFAKVIEIPSYFEQFLKSPNPTNAQGEPLYIFNEIQILNADKVALKSYAQTPNSNLSTTFITFKHVPIIKQRKGEEGPTTRMVLLKECGAVRSKAATKLAHQKNILKLFGNAQSSYLLQYYEDKSKGWNHKEAIMMEFDPQSLGLGEYLIAHRNSLTLSTKLSILGHLANSLRFLHYYKVIHMDLNPNNVLINELNRPRLIDFGESYYQPLGQGQHQSGYTLPYCPPEVFTGRKYNSAQDMFSFGVVAFKCISGDLPFRATDSLINVFRNKMQGTRWYLAPEKVIECGRADVCALLMLLVSKCISAAAEARPLPVWTTIILRQLLLIDR